MNLSFIAELQTQFPEFLFGLSRIKNIDKALTENANWKKEAFEELRKLFLYMKKTNASDIDFGGVRANNFIWFRTFGDKKPCPELPKYHIDETTAIALSILSDEQKEQLFENKSVDFSLSLLLSEHENAPQRLRGNIYFESNSIAVNFRIIHQKIFPIETFRFPENILKRLDLRFEKSGLFLITGITGSGKSSTLDAIINMNNIHNNAHITIIGNPIEQMHKSQKSIVCHREVGQDVLGFRQGTIQALRQDPDIIVIGEMRDAETIATVLEVTDSGHKAFSTLHTSSTVETIHRIIGEFPPEEQERIRFRLADTLKVVISQKLVPNVEGKVTLAKEVLSVDFSIQAAIRNNNISEIFQMITQGKAKGMFTLQQDLLALVKRGEITQETALGYCNNRKIMSQLLHYNR